MASVLEMVMFMFGVFLQWVLEVLGAGGAIWGMSEVWNIRGAKTWNGSISNDRLRWAANIVFILGFIRFFFRYGPQNGFAQALVDPQNWIKDYGAERHEARARAQGRAHGDGQYGDAGIRVFEFLFFLLGVFLQWVLEVLGAGGATWGMSEVWNLRGDTSSNSAVYGGTNDDYRWVANVTFTVAIFRMLQKYCPDHPVHQAMLSPQEWLRDLGKDEGNQGSGGAGGQQGSQAKSTEMTGVSVQSQNADMAF